jgi:hypothetical protein
VTRISSGSERELLQAFLDQQRDVVLWKLESLSDAQLCQPVGPSELYLLGIVKHLAAAEQYWLCELFGLPAEPLSLAASADDLDITARTWVHDTVTFRFALLHMIEDTARHAGHIDAIRQQLDGTTGYLPHNAPY